MVRKEVAGQGWLGKGGWVGVAGKGVAGKEVAGKEVSGKGVSLCSPDGSWLCFLPRCMSSVESTTTKSGQ